MNKIIGEVEVTRPQILHGDHHIVSGAAIADETAKFSAGTLLYKNEGNYVPLAKNDTEHKPVAVAVEPLEEKADGAVIIACLHGAVRAEKLVYADGSAITDGSVEDLRSAGIYCIEGESVAQEE